MQSSQWVRLFDVFIFAPILIAFAFIAKPKKWMKVTVIILAVFTIIYNAFYYIKYKKDGSTIDS